jgi:hypothetical protein
MTFCKTWFPNNSKDSWWSGPNSWYENYLGALNILIQGFGGDSEGARTFEGYKETKINEACSVLVRDSQSRQQFQYAEVEGYEV